MKIESEQKKMVKLKRLINQFIKFIGVSGVGWCLDFSLYLVFTSILGWPVFISNCFSAVPAVTLVFTVSTSKIFQKMQGRVPTYVKYVIYLVYQIILLLIVSSLGQWLAKTIVLKVGSIKEIVNLSKVIAKVMITPITMVMNFGIMKILTERI